MTSNPRELGQTWVQRRKPCRKACPPSEAMTDVPPDDVRRHFAGYPFGDPCTEADLARAEAALGIPIPPVLRTLYLSFNGFLGPTDAGYFWPLFGDRGGLVPW